MKIKTLSILTWALCFVAISFAVSGCATRDAKRDDETYKRPTKVEKERMEAEKERVAHPEK